jgi:hypothetical protein
VDEWRTTATAIMLPPLKFATTVFFSATLKTKSDSESAYLSFIF